MDDFDFLSTFKKVVREANYTNTYKMAWARSLVELSFHDYSEKIVILHLQDFAGFFLKYYWNQTIFFDLIQGSNLIEKPIVIQIVKSLIQRYFSTVGNKQPILFERIEHQFDKLGLRSDYSHALKKIASILHNDVSHRFCNLDGEVLPLYNYESSVRTIHIEQDFLKLLSENATDLFDLINYRWGLMLESYNSSPRINKKVKIIDRQESSAILRNNLNKFRPCLDIHPSCQRCFICDGLLTEESTSIDHVIPWSYMFSDDLWNLAYVHKTCNSQKSNRIPSRVLINKLKHRNTELLSLLQSSKLVKKQIQELELAIQHQLVDKFWLSCQ